MIALTVNGTDFPPTLSTDQAAELLDTGSGTSVAPVGVAGGEDEAEHSHRLNDLLLDP